MVTNGVLPDEPHKTFDTILTLDFGLVILPVERVYYSKSVSFLTEKLQVPIHSPHYKTLARTQCLL
jgi:hypothetical protein